MVATVTWIDDDGNRYPLTFDAGSGLQAGAVGLDAAPVEIRTDERAGDGAALSAVRAPTKSLALPIFFEDRDLLDEMAETFIGRPSRLELNNGIRVRELTDVYYVAGLEGDTSTSKESKTWWNRTVELKALDPYWYGPAESVGLGTPQTPDAYDSTIGYSTAIPWNGPGGGITGGAGYSDAVAYDTAMPYDGGANISFNAITSRLGAWPVITIEGPANLMQIVHLRTVQRVAFRTGVTLGAGQQFVIDSRPTSRGVTLGGNPAWNLVTPDSDPALQIVAGDQLSFILGGTDATSYITVEWRQRWRMP